MAANKRGQRDLIFKRAGSPYYSVRIQYAKATFPRLLAELQKALGDMIDPKTGEKRVLKREQKINLQTTSYAEARNRARPYIDEHLDILAFFEGAISGRPDVAVLKSRRYQPGTQTYADGTRIEATDETFKLFPPNSVLPLGGAQPNPVTQFKFVPLLEEDFVDENGLSPTPLKDRPALKRAIRAKEEAANLAANSAEDRFFDLWRMNGQTKKDRNAVVTIRREFTEFVEGKAIADCKRADAVNFIAAARAAHVPDGTIGRKIAKLCAFVNWTNLNHEDDSPFGGKNIFEKHKFDTKELSRPPFSEADIAKIRASKHIFTDQELLMIAVVGTMSVRPSGIAAVRHCSIESYDTYDDNGNFIETKHTRCLHFPRDKTTSGKVNLGRRTLPIPDQLLNLTNHKGERIFPDKVTGPLFPPKPGQAQEDYTADLLESINGKFDRRLNITTADVKDADTGRTIRKGKSFYSLRHRAKDVLETVAGTPIAVAAMGHARPDVHSTYGHGIPLHEMKEGMNKVRFF